MASSNADAEAQKRNREPVNSVASAPSAPSECARFLLSAAFSFVAGYADVLTLRIYRVFATMMTGNTFMMGSAMVTGETIAEYNGVPVQAWAFRAVVIIGFCVGLLAEEFLTVHVKTLGAATILSPLIAVTSVLLTFLDERRLHVVVMAISFGIQNGVSSRGLGASTTMVTGHLTKLAKALTKIRSRDDAANMSHQNIISIAAVVFLIIGAAVGQCSVQLYQAEKIRWHVMFAPVSPILAILLVINDHIFHEGDVDVIGSGMAFSSKGVDYGATAVASGEEAVGAVVKGVAGRFQQDHQPQPV